MSRPAGRLPILLLAFAATFGTAVWARPARAGDAAEAKGAIERLTAEEMAVDRRRIADWDRLDAAAQERVAQNVLRLRAL